MLLFFGHESCWDVLVEDWRRGRQPHPIYSKFASHFIQLQARFRLYLTSILKIDDFQRISLLTLYFLAVIKSLHILKLDIIHTLFYLLSENIINFMFHKRYLSVFNFIVSDVQDVLWSFEFLRLFFMFHLWLIWLKMQHMWKPWLRLTFIHTFDRCRYFLHFAFLIGFLHSVIFSLERSERLDLLIIWVWMADGLVCTGSFNWFWGRSIFNLRENRIAFLKRFVQDFKVIWCHHV